MSHHHVAETAAQTRIGGRGAFALIVLALTQFMLVIDITAVNVALPLMGEELRLDPALAGWSVAAYAVPFGGLLLLGGRLADVFGSRRMLVIGLIVFTLASLAAAVATGPGLFLGARAAQGVGAALLSPAALSTLVRTFDGTWRRRALAIWGGIGGAGAALGVLLGGVLAGGPGWRWIFLINVPVGILVVIAVPFVVGAMAPGARERLDASSAVLATLGFASLIAAISTTATPPLAIGLAVLAIALLIGFVLVERRSARPLIRLSLLTSRPLASGAVLMFTSTMLLVGTFFVLSFLLQQGSGWSATAAGLAFLPVAIGVIAGAQLAGHLVGRFGGRRIAPIGLLVAAAGLGLTALGGSDVTAITGAAIASLGLGAGFVCASTTALSDVDHAESGAASGALSSFHELGSGVGVAAVAAIAVAGYGVSFTVLAAVALLDAVVAAITLPRGVPAGGAAHFAH